MFIGRVPQTTRLAAIGLQPYRIFTLEEIEEATNNFDQSNLIGEGSEGKVKNNKKNVLNKLGPNILNFNAICFLCIIAAI